MTIFCLTSINIKGKLFWKDTTKERLIKAIETNAPGTAAPDVIEKFEGLEKRFACGKCIERQVQ